MRRPGEVLSRLRPARARVGLRLREPLERRRRLRPAPAREDRPAVRPPLASRRCAAPATGCARRSRREPRSRSGSASPLAFALAMALVLAATGLVPLRPRSASHLATALDRELAAARAGPGRARRQPRRRRSRRRGASRSSSAARATRSCSTPHGRVLDATPPLGAAPLLGPAELAGRAAASRSSRTLAGPGPRRAVARCSRRRSQRDGRRLVLVVGATRAGPRRDAARASATSC